MEIRPVRPEDDRYAISRVYEESWRQAYRGIVPQPYLDGIPRGRWVPFIDTPGMDSLVMVVEGEIVGTSSCCPSRLARMSGWGEIVSLYLLPRVQGMGYGKALLRAAVDALGAMGLRDVFLWVLEDNLRARRFYEHMGFFASGEHLDDVIGGAALREVQYRLCPDGAGDPGKARL